MSATLLVALLVAATPITLEQARAEGRRNTRAQVAALDAARAEARILQARAGLLPQLGLSAGASRTFTGTSRQFATVPVVSEGGEITGVRLEPRDLPGVNQNSFSLGLTLDQVLFDAGRWAALAQAGAQHAASSGQALEEASASEQEAIRRFYELYRAQATLAVLEKTVARSLEQVERARSLFEAGRAGKNDLLTSQVNLGNDRIRLGQQRQVIAGATVELAVWLGRPGAEDLVAQDPGTLAQAPPSPPEVARAVEAARQRRPLLRALERTLDAAGEAIAGARAGFAPTVGGFAHYRRSGPEVNPVFTDPSRNNALSFGLEGRWDFFSGLRTSAQVAEVEHARAQARLNLEQARREVEGEVARTVKALAAQIESWQVAVENLAVAGQALALAEERFRAGAGSTLEVRDAQLNLTRAELSSVESRIDVEITRAALQRGMGELGTGEAR